MHHGTECIYNRICNELLYDACVVKFIINFTMSSYEQHEWKVQSIRCPDKQLCTDIYSHGYKSKLCMMREFEFILNVVFFVRIYVCEQFRSKAYVRIERLKHLLKSMSVSSFAEILSYILNSLSGPCSYEIIQPVNCLLPFPCLVSYDLLSVQQAYGPFKLCRGIECLCNRICMG